MIPDRYKALLFDMDGTLIDTLHLWERYLVEIARERGLGKINELVRNLRNGRDPMRTTYPDLSFDEVRGIYELARRSILRHVGEVKVLIPEEKLLYLSNGRLMGVITQTHSWIAKKLLRGAGLLHLFDVLVTSDVVENVKPHPEPLWRALDEIGECPALYIGDTETDEEAAYRAGIDFLHVGVIHRV